MHMIPARRFYSDVVQHVKHDPLCRQGNHCLLATGGSVGDTGQPVDNGDINDKQASQRLLFFWAPYLSHTEGSVCVPNSSITIRTHTGWCRLKYFSNYQMNCHEKFVQTFVVLRE